MSTNVQIWHFKPKIDISVMHFAFYLWTVFFFSRTCDNDEFFTKPNSWMTMSWMFHGITFDKVIWVWSLNLEKIIEWLVISLIVSSTNHVKLSIWAIYSLEIMWKLTLKSSFKNSTWRIFEINSVNIFRVFLQQMAHSNRCSRILELLTWEQRLRERNNWLGYNSCTWVLYDWLCNHHLFRFRLLIGRSFVTIITLISLLVFHQIVKRISLFTFVIANKVKMVHNAP
jgi:hypothetical protein